MTCNNRKKLDCFDKLIRKLMPNERNTIIALINEMHSDKLDEDCELSVVDGYCLCPFNADKSFGMNYFCSRPRVNMLVDITGKKTDFRKEQNDNDKQLKFDFKNYM